MWILRTHVNTGVVGLAMPGIPASENRGGESQQPKRFLIAFFYCLSVGDSSTGKSQLWSETGEPEMQTERDSNE